MYINYTLAQMMHQLKKYVFNILYEIRYAKQYTRKRIIQNLKFNHKIQGVSRLEVYWDCNSCKCIYFWFWTYVKSRNKGFLLWAGLMLQILLLDKLVRSYDLIYKVCWVTPGFIKKVSRASNVTKMVHLLKSRRLTWKLIIFSH